MHFWQQCSATQEPDSDGIDGELLIWSSIRSSAARLCAFPHALQERDPVIGGERGDAYAEE
jgi:hypothetical protein